MGRKRAYSAIDAHIDKHFVTNEYGIWCPNCEEQIDFNWPVSCDHCGYPSPGYERFDADDYDDREDYYPAPQHTGGR